MAAIPPPVRATLGLLATVVDAVQDLFERAPEFREHAPELPMEVISNAMQASLKAQQRYAELIVRGDELISQFRGVPDEPPTWARFDDDDDDGPAARTTSAGGTVDPGDAGADESFLDDGVDDSFLGDGGPDDAFLIDGGGSDAVSPGAAATDDAAAGATDAVAGLPLAVPDTGLRNPAHGDPLMEHTELLEAGPVVSPSEGAAPVRPVPAGTDARPVRKTPAKRPPAKRTPVNRTPAGIPPAEKAPGQMAPAETPPAEKVVVRKAPATKPPAKKPARPATPGRAADLSTRPAPDRIEDGFDGSDDGFPTDGR